MCISVKFLMPLNPSRMYVPFCSATHVSVHGNTIFRSASHLAKDICHSWLQGPSPSYRSRWSHGQTSLGSKTEGVRPRSGVKPYWWRGGSVSHWKTTPLTSAFISCKKKQKKNKQDKPFWIALRVFGIPLSIQYGLSHPDRQMSLVRKESQCKGVI